MALIRVRSPAAYSFHGHDAHELRQGYDGRIATDLSAAFLDDRDERLGRHTLLYGPLVVKPGLFYLGVVAGLPRGHCGRICGIVGRLGPQHRRRKIIFFDLDAGRMITTGAAIHHQYGHHATP